MSVRATSLVWERSRTKGSPLLVLLAIAQYAEDDGRDAFPSAQRLARDTRLTDRNVRLLMHRLEKQAELLIEMNEAQRVPARAQHPPPWFLHVRCVCAWDQYAAGQSEKFSESRFKPGRRVGGEIGNSVLGNRKFCVSHPLDPLEDPLLKKQETSPPLPLLIPVENSDDNVRVITRMAHEVLDVIGEDDLANLAYCVKRLCAKRKILYNSAVVGKAIDGALFQRRRQMAVGGST